MSIRFHVDPRDVPPEKAARRLGLTQEQFGDLIPRLLSRGFPASDPDTGNYDLDAIDAWRAARHRRILPSSSLPSHSTGLVAARLEKMRG
ncbi:hypothetical protein [Mesorhizobium sp. INR15]|uniref:hypothetical protein n=1 Tax=Mesorhizobium sp. INR15 TaxID=2654248 RepID=UPI0018969BFA|nr:hypothetical protein [Mesorhizobium sp. INR15]QPC93828.1 hypothetical protein GA829_26385 [Mesorhizobium sp. INR15]